ncbi:ARM repeat-containing protein [Hypoxylon sp. NC1633]|nr:ARM repeat-containing protein [Hypoxylon sp. NC1633]
MSGSGSGSSGPSTGSPTLRRVVPIMNAQKEENIRVGKEDSSAANGSQLLTGGVRLDPDNQPSQKKSASALLASSSVNQSVPKKMKLIHDISTPPASANPNSIDHLLGKLSQTTSFNNQDNAVKSSEMNTMYPVPLEHGSSSTSVPITPASETFGSTGPSTRPASAALNDGVTNQDEVLRLKLQLAQAHSQIDHLGHELAQTRQSRPASEHGVGNSPPSMNFPPGFPPTSNPSQVPGLNLNNPGGQQAFDARSDTSDAMPTTGFNRPRNIWGPNKGNQPSAIPSLSGPELPTSGQWGRHGANQDFVDPNMAYDPPAGNYRGGRLTPDYDMTIKPPGNRRGNRFDRLNMPPPFGPQQGFGGAYNYGGSQYGGSQYGGSEQGMPGPSQGPAGSGMYSGYHATAGGTSLSPLASEFTSSAGGAPWKSESPTSEGQTYLPTTEPLNYRRLLDRNVNCNWKYIVDKIVCNNDQQASIFLQQKLKVGTPDQKYEIVEAIVAQAYPLMVNRFGNFLVQRCFEHGTPEQVVNIANAIRGSTLNLSMDPFGCHVVQKAFDSVPEDYKAVMVNELLRRIPETVIHRYACHVWQKLFELRWTESPPQIMKYVNEALRNMWHEVALGETGSLVVQNIFENCLEEDKRPCIEEVLANIDIIAHGQFGNWCIQHICEHGAPADRSRAIDHVIRYAAEYSTDQYASKVVEKCLKIGGSDFLTRYLDRVCESRMDRPRNPLIDIASDQYGNYLIQWILTHASAQHREIVAAHIRKHMVSLRGSKFGSRVGILCTNPNSATRPGPGVGAGMGRMPAGPRYNARAYQ